MTPDLHTLLKPTRAKLGEGGSGVGVRFAPVQNALGKMAAAPCIIMSVSLLQKESLTFCFQLVVLAVSFSKWRTLGFNLMLAASLSCGERNGNRCDLEVV